MLNKLLQLFKKKAKDLNIIFIGSQKPNLKIGKYTYINGMKIYCWDKTFQLNIGKYCSFADNIVIIGGGEHDKDWVSTFPFIDRWKLDEYKQLKRPRFKGNINIENDVWIANNVTILSGVTIGNGAIIGANTTVTKNVPEYSIVVGNPMQILKYRFNKNIIDQLLKIQWWEWSEEKIKKHQDLFINPQKFIKEFQNENSNNNNS